jgi:hypothetical protein
MALGRAAQPACHCSGSYYYMVLFIFELQCGLEWARTGLGLSPSPRPYVYIYVTTRARFKQSHNTYNRWAITHITGGPYTYDRWSMYCAGVLLPTVMKPHRHLSLYHLIWDLAPFICARGRMVDHMPTDLAVRGWACPNRPTVRTICAVAPGAGF